MDMSQKIGMPEKANGENEENGTVVNEVPETENMLSNMSMEIVDDKVEKVYVVNSREQFVEPDIYDGTTCWSGYKIQFETAAKLNRWNDEEKTMYLMTKLRGKARKILEVIDHKSVSDIQYSDLISYLDVRFGVEMQCDDYYRVLLENRVRRPDETLPELGFDILRLVKLAERESDIERQNKLAVKHFLNAINDWDMRVHIQLNKKRKTIIEAIKDAVFLETLRKKRDLEFGQSCSNSQLLNEPGQNASDLVSAEQSHEVSSKVHKANDIDEAIKANTELMSQLVDQMEQILITKRVVKRKKPVAKVCPQFDKGLTKVESSVGQRLAGVGLNNERKSDTKSKKKKSPSTEERGRASVIPRRR